MSDNDIRVPLFQVTEGDKTDLIDTSFPVEDLTAEVITSPQFIGAAIVRERVPVWVGRDHARGPTAWVGKDDKTHQNILLVNAHYLDSQRGLAKILLMLTGADMGMDKAEAEAVLAKVCEAAGIWEAEQEALAHAQLEAAKTVTDTRESAKQKRLAELRVAGALPAAPPAPELALGEGDAGDAAQAKGGYRGAAPEPDTDDTASAG